MIIRPAPEIVEVLPVIFVPPPQDEQPPPDPTPDNEEPPPDVAPLDAPVVATVVAADTSQVAFAVPVEGPVVLAPAKYASAPPAQPPKAVRPPSITVFRPGRDTKGTFPKPPYVNGTLRPGEHAEVTLYVEVEPDGIPSKVEVFKSCGSSDLDRSTMRHVKNRWRWNPGERRTHYVPIEYQIQ